MVLLDSRDPSDGPRVAGLSAHGHAALDRHVGGDGGGAGGVLVVVFDVLGLLAAVDGHGDDDDEADDENEERDEVSGQVGGRADRPGSGRVGLGQVLHVDVVALRHDLVRRVGAVVDAVARLVQVDALAGNGAL